MLWEFLKNVHTYANLIKSPCKYLYTGETTIQFQNYHILYLVFGWRSSKLHWDFSGQFDISFDIPFDVPIETETARVPKLSLFQHLAIAGFKHNIIFIKKTERIRQNVKELES